jgi:hypothetical protein
LYIFTELVEMHQNYPTRIPMHNCHPHGLNQFNDACFICQTNLVKCRVSCGHAYCDYCTGKLINWEIRCPLCVAAPQPIPSSTAQPITSSTPQPIPSSTAQPIQHVEYLASFSFLSAHVAKSVVSQTRLGDILAAAAETTNKVIIRRLTGPSNLLPHESRPCVCVCVCVCMW